MCFAPDPPQQQPAPAPAPPAPAPSPVAQQVSPTSVRDKQDVEAYGAGGTPNLRRSDGAGVGTKGAGAGIRM